MLTSEICEGVVAAGGALDADVAPADVEAPAALVDASGATLIAAERKEFLVIA